MKFGKFLLEPEKQSLRQSTADGDFAPDIESTATALPVFVFPEFFLERRSKTKSGGGLLGGLTLGVLILGGLIIFSKASVGSYGVAICTD